MARFDLSLEHKVIKALKPVKGRVWLLAISGGVDSMVLAEILWRWRGLLKVELIVAHVHHGLGRSAKQNRFRHRAQTLVRSWCEKHGARFLTNEPEHLNLRSEAELRAYRRKKLINWMKASGADHIVFAHHQDDLLETQLLRLLRGSGRQGLRAMAVRRGAVLRPLLTLSGEEIRRYARVRGLKWVEDPSNRDPKALRNWLRHKWLPQLEKRSRGAKKALARSLSLIAEDRFVESVGDFVGLRRAPLNQIEPERRESVVARYLRVLGAKNYTRSHVQELLKRLGPGSCEFEMLGFSFRATSDFLWASRVE